MDVLGVYLFATLTALLLSIGLLIIVAEVEKQSRYIRARKNTEARPLDFRDFKDYLRAYLSPSKAGRAKAWEQFPRGLARQSHTRN